MDVAAKPMLVTAVGNGASEEFGVFIDGLYDGTENHKKNHILMRGMPRFKEVYAVVCR